MLEFEQLLKVFFADHGTKEEALAGVRRIRRWASERDAENERIAIEYLAGRGPFPERAAVLSVMGGFWMRYVDGIAEWAEWAERTIAAWPDDLSEADPAWEVWEGYARRSEARRASAVPDSSQEDQVGGDS